MRSLSISSAGGTMPLDGSQGVSAKLKVKGLGMAPVQVQWFEGAGEGASFRGGRTLPRLFELPITVYADPSDWTNRDLVRSRFASVARILSLANAPVRVSLDLNAGDPTNSDIWWADMVRTGGGAMDWEQDTDGRSFIKSVFSLQAGDPYWTSLDQDSKVISPAGVGLGLLASGVSLAQLRLGTSDGFGTTTINNTGDVEGWPTWTVGAPFTGFSLTSQYGEQLVWTATKQGLAGGTKSTGFIVVNTKDGTVKDETGANMYKGLDPAPQFWSVRPGPTTASVLMSGATGATVTNVVWNVRREVLF